MASRIKKPKRVKVVYNWDGVLYSDRPNRKRAKILTAGELKELQARCTVIIEQYE